MASTVIGSDVITTNGIFPFTIDGAPSTVNLKNSGAATVTVLVRVGSNRVLADYTTSKTLAAGEVAQVAIAECYHTGELVVTANTSQLVADLTY